MKNPSPREIAVYSCSAFSSILFVALIIIRLFFLSSLSWGLVFAIPIFSFGLAYLFFTYFIEKFIYRKIKLIYKNIHSLKTPKSKKPFHINLDDDIIGEVEQEVNEWALDRHQEIEDLKKMASYRKEFIGNVTHELKTPIFNIQGYIHTLIDGGLEDEKINKSYLYKASDNVDRLSHIVEDLETITQIETDSLILDITDFDIIELIKEVFEELEMQADLKGVSFNFKEGTPKTALVKADRDRIRQVLTNLITNSIRYGKENGNTTLSVYDMEENVWVEVADDGVGIAEEHLPRLFERFYRVDKSRSREQGGTGLGLSIVKHIIEAHGQTVNVRSQIGVGSTFGFSLKKA